MKQVSRTTTTKIAEDEIDPLSAFAQEQPSHPPPPPPVIIRDDADQRDKSEFVTVEKLSMVSSVRKETLPPSLPSSAVPPPPVSPQKMRLGSLSPMRNQNNEEPQRPGSMRLSSSSVVSTTNNAATTLKGPSGENSPNPNALSSSSLNDALDDFPFMSGEMKVMSMTHAAVHVIPIGGISGILYMTNYRVVFLPSQADVDRLRRTSPSFLSWLNVPLACIDRIEREKRPKETPNAGITMMIYCKDCRQLRINIKPQSSSNGDYDLERAFSLMNTYAFPNNPRYLFAFNHSIGRLNIGTLQDEYARMGLYKSPLWRISRVNLDYRLCSTYPEDLVVPTSISDDDLHVVGAFRSGHRLPVLCWATDRHAASMWRSSQPKAGVSGSCLQDIRLLEVIARSTAVQRQRSSVNGNNPSDSLLYIVDARSRNSAMANMAAGAGYESQNYYSSSRLDFYNIPNIHAVRDSYKGMLNLVLNPTANPSSDISFSKQIEDTAWLTNVRLILKASFETAGFINKGFPVLVHCSHGWDRTAQITSLAQLFLDPFYRTFEGFPVLIEKEWFAFGHQFQMRCAHGQDKAQRQEQEFSPIFIQFLDCLWQVLNKFGQHFEYNTKYVLTVAEHVYSGRFGTFLFSSELDRRTYQARTHSADLWQYLASNRSLLTNPFYTAVPGVYLPPLGQLLRGVTIWSDYFLRWSSVVSIPSLHGDLAEYTGLLRRLEDTDSDQRVASVSLPNPYDSMMFQIVSTGDFLEAQWAKERFHRLSVERELKESVSRHQRSLEALLKLVRDRVPSELMSELETEIHRMEGEEARTVQEIIATHHDTASSRHASTDNHNNHNNSGQKTTPLDPLDSSLTTAAGDDEEFQPLSSTASSSHMTEEDNNHKEVAVGSVDEEDMVVMSGNLQLPGHLSSAECIEVLQTAAEVKAEAAADSPLLASPMSPLTNTTLTLPSSTTTSSSNNNKEVKSSPMQEEEEFFV